MPDHEHDHDHDPRNAPLSYFVRSFFTNWNNSDMPFAEKLALAMRNRAIAMRKGCCGHRGQPGC